MVKYRWVNHVGGKLYSIGILADGTLHNPNGYPDDVVRAAVLAADARKRRLTDWHPVPTGTAAGSSLCASHLLDGIHTTKLGVNYKIY